MVLRVGDSLFTKNGNAGFVVSRDKQKETLDVAQAGPEYEKGRRYGFINGMENEQREEFEAVIDKVREFEEPKERVDYLHKQIETLKEDPRRGVLARYLQGEMAHIMNSEGISPRIYTVDETKT